MSSFLVGMGMETPLGWVLFRRVVVGMDDNILGTPSLPYWTEGKDGRRGQHSAEVFQTRNQE